jgi:RND family efflux transporter MFP subunit
MHALFDSAHSTLGRLVPVAARLAAATLLVGAAAAACGPRAPGPGGPPSMAPPAMPVEIVTLAPKPIEQASEFVGVVKSRRSTTIQPQVEGFITRIAVKSGDRVKPGDVLMEIDSRSQEAAIASLESVRAARDIDVTFARQEAQRAKTLLDAGAGSQQDYDKAINALKAAEAQVRTLEEQIRQQRTDLAYYHVTAPTAGIVGDIPVRQGDRVTKTTLLTTLDDNAGLEIYINVPVQQAVGLKIGLPVRLLGDADRVIAEERITFIAASVDETQTVLVKAALGSAAGFRTDQFVRARLVWNTTPGLTIPIVSALRINGQYFAFVAEEGQRGAVAHQRPVTLGPVIGNEYLVLSGLKAGDRLIVSGIQKIGDGAPVRVGGGPPSRPAGPGGRGQ